MSIINPLPYNIVNGQAIDATPVMANFNEILNDVNANAAPLATTANSGANNNITSLGGLTTPLSVPLSGSVSLIADSAAPLGLKSLPRTPAAGMVSV